MTGAHGPDCAETHFQTSRGRLQCIHKVDVFFVLVVLVPQVHVMEKTVGNTLSLSCRPC